MGCIQSCIVRRFSLLFFFAVLALFIVCGNTSTTNAQVPGFVSQETLELSPAFPEPGDQVEVSLNIYSQETVGASIYWFVNEQEDVSARNTRTITIPAGNLGVPTKIRATLVFADGRQIVTERTIIPTYIDVIVEANTTAPIFYKGKRHWSSGSRARIVAIPHLSTGSNADSFSYQWILDSTVLGGGPIYQKNYIDVQMPRFRNSVLTVSVLSREGVVVGEKSIALNPTTPEVLFYQTSPLSGLSRTAISDQLVLSGGQLTIRAEPYFFDTNLSPDTAAYQWKIDGLTTDTANSDPQALTLEKSGAGIGSSEIWFRIVNMEELVQHAENSFNLFFQ